MYLFQPNWYGYLNDTAFIYIPLCIYFNFASIAASRDTQAHLHSTMYLFQQRKLIGMYCYMLNLHSTMYLFQPYNIR